MYFEGMTTLVTSTEFLDPSKKEAILVTGGVGFIGSHLVERALEAGQRVVILDNFDPFYSEAIKRQNFETLKKKDSTGSLLTLITGDIRELPIPALEKAGPYRGVIHLAARPGVRPSIEDPKSYTEINVTGTVNLLEFARRAGIRHFIFGSSSSVYGNHPKVPFTETMDVNEPISPYAATKRAGELLSHTFHHLYRLNVICLRFFTVYGPRQRPDLAIHKFVRLIDEGKPITMFGDGETERDYTYVADIIQGVVAAWNFSLRSKEPVYEIVNLGESQTISLKQMISEIESAIGKKAEIKREPMQPGDVNRTFADISKAKSLLGYAPRYPFQKGIENFVEWYRGL